MKTVASPAVVQKPTLETRGSSAHYPEENLTALETCPSDEKEEAEKQSEPKKAQRCRRDQLPVGDLVASPLCSAFTEAQEDSAPIETLTSSASSLILRCSLLPLSPMALLSVPLPGPVISLLILWAFQCRN
ncbi:hypothetical protein CB1_060782084 [Camelus ferus]|nr:hypothetical protein CB1_060782084 [Camelus ferus]